jgi:hypothetical protein
VWLGRSGAEDRCGSAGQEPSNGNVMLHWHPLDAGVIYLNADVSTWSTLILSRLILPRLFLFLVPLTRLKY